VDSEGGSHRDIGTVGGWSDELSGVEKDQEEGPENLGGEEFGPYYC